MKRICIPILIIALTCLGCQKSNDKEQAIARLQMAEQLVETNHLNAARLQLDSIHLLYPHQVEVRRLAKSLNDSITYLESVRTQAYADSLMLDLMPTAEKLLSEFRHEKNDEYENHGRYIHPLLITDRNNQRCMLQATVTDDLQLRLKSFYYGASPVNHTTVTLSADEYEISATDTPHCFQAEGYYEILTLDTEHSRQLLNFIAANDTKRIKVSLNGKKQYSYYLQDNEKQALAKTYQLFLTLTDIHILEDNINKTAKQIERIERSNFLH